MAITVKHKFVSAIPDAGDPTIVQPSNWNDNHDLVGTVPVANGGTGASTLTGYVKGNGTAAMTAATTIPSTDVTGLGTMSTQNANNVAITGGTMSGVAVTGYIPTTEKGVANGVATLDAGGKVPQSQIPMQGDINYQGTWNASTNTPTLVSSVGTKGYYYVVDVAGNTNLNGITDWQIGDWCIYNGTVWQKVDNTDAVTSVNGYTGTVVLTAADVSAVPYTGATTAVNLNAKSLTNVSNLGVGTSTVPTILMRAVGDNNSSSRIAMRGYSSNANSSAIRVTKFRGTAGAPQAPQSGDSLGKFELAGYGTTSSEGYPQASLEGLATEAWGATARGTKAVIKVTPNTTTTQVTALTIDQNSAATFASSVTATSFSGSGSGLTSIPNSALTNSAITINGTSTSLGGSISVGTVTSVAATAGTGISVSGSPITSSGTLTITNTAPDQTVALTSGTGISVTGTYPNFTVTNTAPSSGGTVTSVGATAPIASSGGNTPTISIATANTTTTGALTSTDWNTFNNKQTALVSGTNIKTVNSTSLLGSGDVSVGVLTVAGTAPVVSSGGANPAISMAAANGTTNGYLTSTDWTTFNNKSNTNGTVTSVAALTLGTTGTDLSSTVATGTTTPVISLQVPTASALNRGALSSTDWSTFNGKQATLVSGTSIKTVNNTSLLGAGDVPVGVLTVTGTAPVVSSGGANPALSMAAATTSVNGYLTSTDWTTFNSKAAPFTYTTNYIPYGQGTTTPNQNINFTFDGTTQSAPVQRASNGIVTNNKTIAANYTIPATDNAMSAGPVTISSGIVVTVSSGSRWVVL